MRLLYSLILLSALLLPSHGWAAIAYGTTSSGTEDTADNSFATGALTVNAGDAIVCGVKWETAGTLSSISDGTNSLTLTTSQTYASGAAFLQGGYLANAAGGGSGIFTFTFSSGSTDYKRGACVTYSGAATSSLLDQQSTNSAAAGPNATSGNVTTTNANNACVGWGGAFTGGTWSGQVINGVSANVRFAGSDFTVFERITSATFTGQALASHSIGAGTPVAGAIACIKESGGGGGGSTVRNLMLMGVGQ